MSLFNKDFGPGLRVAIRLAGRRGGATRDQIATVLDGVTTPDGGLDQELIQSVATAAGTDLPAFVGDSVGAGEGVTGAFDGSILKKIIDFLTSPQGQAFIKAIFAIFGIILAF